MALIVAWRRIVFALPLLALPLAGADNARASDTMSPASALARAPRRAAFGRGSAAIRAASGRPRGTTARRAGAGAARASVASTSVLSARDVLAAASDGLSYEHKQECRTQKAN